MNLLCFVGRHRRSRRHVRHDTQDYVSVCAGCGVGMRKHRDGSWRSEGSDGWNAATGDTLVERKQKEAL